MVIDKPGLSRMLLSAAELLEKNTDELSAIDSHFGDGDHGITIGKIAHLLQKNVGEWGDESISEFLDDLGTAIMAVRGGSAGPLYGTMIGGLGIEVEGKEELDAEGAKAMLRGSLSEMQDLTTAKVGDKTMMDALIPAVEAALKAEGDAKAVWMAAAEAAEAGAEASKQFVSKFGRAKSYKEETIGTPDAGAVSTALFIRGMVNGL